MLRVREKGSSRTRLMITSTTRWNVVEVEDPNAEPDKECVYTIDHEVNVVNLSQSGCEVKKEKKRKQPGNGTQEPKNKRRGMWNHKQSLQVPTLSMKRVTILLDELEGALTRVDDDEVLGGLMENTLPASPHVENMAGVASFAQPTPVADLWRRVEFQTKRTRCRRHRTQVDSIEREEHHGTQCVVHVLWEGWARMPRSGWEGHHQHEEPGQPLRRFALVPRNAGFESSSSRSTSGSEILGIFHAIFFILQFLNSA